LLNQTLEEEKQADKRLTELAQEINPKTAKGEASTSESSGQDQRGSKSRKAA
jgi:hypothetical protein